MLLACLLLGKTASAQSDSNKPTGLDNRPPLEKKVFIHYRQGFGRPADLPAKGKPKEPSCYGFLAKGAYWKELPQDIILGENLPNGLSKQLVEGAVRDAFGEWDSHTGALLSRNYTFDPNASWDDEVSDGRNEVLFDSYSNNNVIAVTIIWGYFSGPIQTREILEFDILFNNYFTWGDAQSDPGLMDVQNIATHELGHGLGLDDIYQTSCSLVTMYGYSSEGDIEKRDLAPADITGIQKLYGI